MDRYSNGWWADEKREPDRVCTAETPATEWLKAPIGIHQLLTYSSLVPLIWDHLQCISSIALSRLQLV